MLEALDITAEQAAGLDELAAEDLAMAREFSRRARAAEDPDVANGYARSYQRMARSYRQTLGLKVKLKRDLERALQDNPPPRDAVRIRQRKDDLRTAIQRVVWTEQEPLERPDCEEDDLFGDQIGRLEAKLRWDAVRDPGFTTRPLDDHVLALCADLDFRMSLAGQWRDLPDPPPSAFIDWDAVYENSS